MMSRMAAAGFGFGADEFPGTGAALLPGHGAGAGAWLLPGLGAGAGAGAGAAMAEHAAAAAMKSPIVKFLILFIGYLPRNIFLGSSFWALLAFYFSR